MITNAFRRWELRVVLFAILLGPFADSSRGDFAVERVLNGLNQPMYVTQAPGDAASLFVVERSDGSGQLGRIRQYDMMTGALSTFLDVNGTVVDDGGLIGLTFHPDYQTNGLFYVLGTNGSTSALDEYQVVSGTPQLQRRIIQYTHPIHVWHTIDQAHFRPNGNNNELFVLTGDGGTQANEGAFNPALIESPNSIFGKVLRVDLNADFSTPADAATHAGIDVVALGIRNPYRSSFDRATGDFYFGDVGFTSVEEVDFIPASHFANPAAPPLDFGWTAREGTIANPWPPGGPLAPGDINPIFDYPHGSTMLPHPPALNGFAVVGGYVYRGPVAELQGRYFLSDHINGNVYSGQFDTNTLPANYNGTNLTGILNHTVDFENRIGGGANIQFVSSFGEDHAGNLYIVKIGTTTCANCAVGTGEIFRVAPIVTEMVAATIDRETGVISLTNATGADIDFTSLAIASSFEAIDPDALTPISGTYDFNGNGEVDDNDPWTITSPVDSHTVLREQSTGDAGTLGPGEQVSLSLPGGWIRSPNEDLVIGLLLDNGIVIHAEVDYTGHGDQPYSRSDFNFDDELDASDWTLFKTHHRSDLSGLSLAQAYSFGDLDGDGKNDFSDFRLFQADYILANGEAAFRALNAQIPEPGSLALAFVCAAVLLVRSRR